MGRFLSVVLQIVRRNLFLYAFIVLVLASGKWLRTQWIEVQQIVRELPALSAARQDVREHQAVLGRRLGLQVARWSRAGASELDAEIRALDSEIALLQREQSAASLPAALVKGADAIAAQLRQQAIRAMEIELRRQTKAHLGSLHARLVVMENRQAAQFKREQLRKGHVQVYAALQTAQRQLAQLEAVSGVVARIPFTDAYRQVQGLKRQIERLRAENSRAHQQFVAQQALLGQLALPAALAEFSLDRRRLSEASAGLRERLAQAETLAAQNTAWRAYAAVRPVLPLALAVLIGWWLLPAAIRTVLYFGFAPLAARRPPIVIAEAGAGSAPRTPGLHGAPDGPRISAQSRIVSLAPGDELIIRPDYCQSYPAGVRVTTQLLFDWRHWLTSIAANLCCLKRLRAMQALDVVVSATVDAFDEVALLRIGAGEAIVLQPRALVGMCFRSGKRPRIRSHWRIGTLHAWLTFQFRYLVFEGPATLVVKGCRGVRMESASSGQSISQDATLGFSVNAAYATVRGEPFLPYLRGRQALFHDLFKGQDACYLYEEVPRNERPGGQRNNPLEALVDACLKAFGI